MNEAETRAEHIDPALKAAGWGVVEGSKILREYRITEGRIEGRGRRGKADIADYVLVYRNTKLGVMEGKAEDEELTEGVGQAKNYATKLGIRHTFSTNGRGIYAIDMETVIEGEVAKFPTPEELWNLTFPSTRSGTGDAADKASELAELWRDRFAEVPFEDRGGYFLPRYYQDIAIDRTLEALAAGQKRILLTLATGTGKTFIAFQIAWNLSSTGSETDYVARRPRILFLADRNILANQAYNAFSAFPEDALVRIDPGDIRKKGRVPKNGSLFFTIFQTFMASAGSATGASAGSATRLVAGATRCSAGSEHATSELAELPEIAEPNESAGGYMYILGCGDDSFYTGNTTDLHLRLEQHRSGDGAQHTSARLPVKLLYYEAFDRIAEAFAREKQVQGWSRAKKKALISGKISELKQLSRSSAGSLAAVPEPVEGYFGEYPPDFFDLIFIDECHRGGANDESNWRGILEYYAPAVQIGLTATPKRAENVNTYRYFGEPVYVYSLKDGINDGFLTPFKVRQISTTLDEYVYTADDKVVEGEIESGKRYFWISCSPTT